MKLSVDGLVIWEVKTGEADRVITILTKGGVVTAYARNSLLPKNKLTSPTALLAYSNFELFSGKNMYTVDDAASLNRFIKLHTDVERYALAAYFCELCRQLAPIEDDASEYLSLMLNALFALNEGKKDISLIKSAFELRIMTLSGYMPDLAMCCECGVATPDELYFDCLAGKFTCKNCAAERGAGANCNSAVLKAMRHITTAPAEKMLAFSLGVKNAMLLSQLSSCFVTTQLDRGLPTLDFFNSLQI